MLNSNHYQVKHIGNWPGKYIFLRQNENQFTLQANHLTALFR